MPDSIQVLEKPKHKFPPFYWRKKYKVLDVDVSQMDKIDSEIKVLQKNL